MTNFQGLYDIRDYREEDKNFILATFLRGLYYGDSWFSQIDKPVFMENYKKVIENLVDSPKTLIKVACLKEEHDVIIGYSILSANYHTVHWVYVKNAFRKAGIGRSLVPSFPNEVTHLTTLGKSLMNKIPTAKFNPFKLGV